MIIQQYRLDHKEINNSNYIGFQLPIFFAKKNQFKGIVSIVSYKKELYDAFIIEAERQFEDYIERIRNLKEGSFQPEFTLDASLIPITKEFDAQQRFAWQFVLRTEYKKRIQLIPLDLHKKLQADFNYYDPNYVKIKNYRRKIAEFKQMMSPLKDWKKGKNSDIRKILKQSVREDLKNEMTHRILLEL